MGRMFHIVSETWNPVIGCLHYCSYCYAMRLVETRLKKITKKYRDGFFSPKLVELEFKKRFKPNTVIFCCDMGDLFGEWVEETWIERVLGYIAKFPRTTFLLLTKNPSRYREFVDIIPKNAILGATIETDIDSIASRYSRAPPVTRRIQAMIYLAKNHKELRRFISIEPIMKFSPAFGKLILEIEPSFVYIGYDNWRSNLIEPTLEETRGLIRFLRSRRVKIFEKTIRKSNKE